MTDFDRDSEMAQKGYIPGVPTWGLMEDYNNDAKLCTGSTYRICGHKGLELRMFLDWSTLRYRAFVGCPRCGNVEQL